jgi:hypothetical protein
MGKLVYISIRFSYSIWTSRYQFGNFNLHTQNEPEVVLAARENFGVNVR